MIKHILLSTILALAACGSRGPGPLSLTFDAAKLASVPLEAKEDITKAQQQHELALLAKSELAAEARDAAIEEDLAVHQARHGYVVSVAANRDPSLAATAKPDAAAVAAKAADAKVACMRARRALLGELAAWAGDHVLAAQAKLELARARIAGQHGIGIAVDVPAFERQAQERDKVAEEAKQAVDVARTKAEVALGAWTGLDEKALEASGLRGPLENRRYVVELDLLRAERIAQYGLRHMMDKTAPKDAPAPTTDPDELAAAIDKGIKKIDDTTFEISKDLVEKVLLNPMAIAKGARVVPAMKNGQPEGFKLYAIRPGSLYAKIGLANGDTLTAINGFELTSADKALEVYPKLREASNLELEIVRRGKPVVLKYTIK